MALTSMTLRDAAEGLRTQPTRFFLSCFAIAVGMIALTLLVAVLTALQEKSTRLVQDLGVDVIGVLRDTPRDGLRKGLSLHHAQLLEQNFPELIVSTLRSDPAPTLGTRQQLTVVATDQHLISVRNWPVLSGRFLDQRDVANQERHAVISRALSESWSWEVGQIIYIMEVPFIIVGIVAPAGHALDGEQDDTRLILGDRAVFVPKTVTPYWIDRRAPPGSEVDAVFVKGNSVGTRQMLPGLHQILNHPDQEIGKISWITPESLLKNITRLKETIGLTIGTVAVLCLVLGGTTLMSLMVANVRDRTTEIGLRRALGATGREISLLFVIESILVTTIAAGIGTLVAHGVIAFGAELWPLPVKFDWVSFVFPPLTAILLGIMFAYWPANMAARIMPSEALRDE